MDYPNHKWLTTPAFHEALKNTKTGWSKKTSQLFSQPDCNAKSASQRCLATASLSSHCLATCCFSHRSADIPLSACGETSLINRAVSRWSSLVVLPKKKQDPGGGKSSWFKQAWMEKKSELLHKIPGRKLSYLGRWRVTQCFTSLIPKSVILLRCISYIPIVDWYWLYVNL